MTGAVRTRFAPSPTGEPHIGNARSALFGWLFARHSNGVFILRIEDTDVERKVEGSVQKILDGLRWLGMDWDEGPEVGGPYGPYFQSERLELYHKYAQQLVDGGRAYYCYCSPQRLDAMRAEQIKRKMPPGYDRHCRNLSEPARKELQEQGVAPVVRLKAPLTGKTAFHDEIYGDVVFDNSSIDDLVLLKSDGFPTYHLANVIDDHFMQVTHVLRADEWLSSTPRHVMMYDALGWDKPAFAHLPMLLGPDRSKLGKRHGATSLLEFREQGFLPEAMVNFLALLGWSLDDKTELMTRDELVRSFSLERVSKTAAIFNHEKLRWMNGVYIRRLAPGDFALRCLPFLENGLPPEVPRPIDTSFAGRVMALFQDRVKVLSEAPGLARYFFAGKIRYDASLLISKGMTADSTRQALITARRRLETLPSFDAATLEAMLRPLAEETQLKAGQLFGALRTAVSGETATPPLFQMMEVLGRECCLQRIDEAIGKLEAGQET